MEMLTLDRFVPHVGGGFRVRLDAERVVAMELAEVKPLGAQPGGVVRAGDGRQPFALYFKGPGDVVLRQGTYRIEHNEMGALEIFIVAIGPGQGGMMYEAIFA